MTIASKTKRHTEKWKKLKTGERQEEMGNRKLVQPIERPAIKSSEKRSSKSEKVWEQRKYPKARGP
jgi:hypothetical protein